MGGKLACHFVGHEQKAEKCPCSPSPSCPLDTARARQSNSRSDNLFPTTLDDGRPSAEEQKTA
jgi:hypothetical protein